MPAYNAARFIGGAIESLLSQTFDDFELLVFDDGSTDDTASVVNGFNDPRIVLHRSAMNQGIVARLNEGIALATGKYIARMDADDRSDPRRFSRQIAVMETEPDIGVCGTWVIVMNTQEQDEGHHHYPVGHDDICCAMIAQNPFAHSSVMVRRSVLDEHTLRYEDSYEAVEDYELWSRIMRHTRLCNIPEYLVRYRHHPQQVSRVKSAAQQANLRRVQVDIVNREVLILDKQEERDYVAIVSGDHADADYGRSLRLVQKLIGANRRTGFFSPGRFERFFLEKCRQLTFYALKENRASGLMFLALFPLKTSSLFISTAMSALKMVIRDLFSRTGAR